MNAECKMQNAKEVVIPRPKAEESRALKSGIPRLRFAPLGMTLAMVVSFLIFAAPQAQAVTLCCSISAAGEAQATSYTSAGECGLACPTACHENSCPPTIGCVQLSSDLGGQCYTSCANVVAPADCTPPGTAMSTLCAGGSYRLCGAAPTTAPSTTPAAPAGGGATGVRGVALPNPLGTTSAPVILGRVIRTLTGFAGGIALLVFIYGGMLWLTSAGNPEKIKKGKDLILWAALGMAIMFGSYIIVRYILVAFTRGVVTP